MRLFGKRRKSDPHLLQAQQTLSYLFGVTNGEREKRVSLNSCKLSQQKKKKVRNVPLLLQAQRGHLFACGHHWKDAPMPKDARHLHVANCSLEGVLEFDSHMRQCFSKCLTVSKRGVGARGGIGWLVVLGLTAL